MRFLRGPAELAAAVSDAIEAVNPILGTHLRSTGADESVRDPVRIRVDDLDSRPPSVAFSVDVTLIRGVTTNRSKACF